MVVFCARASNEVGAVCLQGDAKGEVLREESLVLEGLSAAAAAVFRQRTRPPVVEVGSGPLELAWQEKIHQQGSLPSLESPGLTLQALGPKQGHRLALCWL